uniref:Uncharacterized protein n=1 Tax=Rhipicephalus microplus TaxID=6941 RepID=A0A6G5AF83_RHIMP
MNLLLHKTQRWLDICESTQENARFPVSTAMNRFCRKLTSMSTCAFTHKNIPSPVFTAMLLFHTNADLGFTCRVVMQIQSYKSERLSDFRRDREGRVRLLQVTLKMWFEV